MFGVLGRMPWYMHLAVSLAFAAFAVWMHGDLVRIEEEKAAALQQPVPEPVMLGAFRKDRDIHPADEVHVIGWINPEFNYQLTKERKGSDTERLMFVLFDGGQGEEARIAHAAILIPPSQKARFFDWLKERNPPEQMVASMLAAGIETPIFRFHGEADRTPTLKSMAEDAFEESGLTRADDFIYLEPFLEGREAALAANPDFPRQAAMFVGGLSLFFLLIALVKFLSRRRSRATASPAEAASAVQAMPAAVAPADDSAWETEAQTDPRPRSRNRRWTRSPRFWIVLAIVGGLVASGAMSTSGLIVLISGLIVPLILVYFVIRTISRSVRSALGGVRASGPVPIPAVNQNLETLGGDRHNLAADAASGPWELPAGGASERGPWQAFGGADFVDPRLTGQPAEPAYGEQEQGLAAKAAPDPFKPYVGTASAELLRKHSPDPFEHLARRKGGP